MRFIYCPYCGERLIEKEIGDEGSMPFCERCSQPMWDNFTTCIITAAINEEGEVALIRQGYVSATSYVCVAGVMKKGESAEETVIREVREELGLEAEAVAYVGSYPYEKKDMLMLGFKTTVKKADFILSGEVDSAGWFTAEEALEKLRTGSIAWKLVKSCFGEETVKNGVG